MEESYSGEVIKAWKRLPLGARTALEQQWVGLAAGGLPCGSAIVNSDGRLIAVGRNYSYEPAGAIQTHTTYPLQHTRLAHAELNAIALVPTEVDHARLTLWSTQHPCMMCAASIRFCGIGSVWYIADDPSDDSSTEAIEATRSDVEYRPFGDSMWWTVSNLLFLYTPAVRQGRDARNLGINQTRYPELVRLTLDLAQNDSLGAAARSGTPLPLALEPHAAEVRRVAEFAPK